MGTSTNEIFGSGGAEPALPGSYGEAPSGYRLPAAVRLGTVRLQVSSLDRSLEWYTGVLGLRVLEQVHGEARLGADGAGEPLVELHERPGISARPRGRLGLYHFAILLPSRVALGAFVRQLAERGVPAGAGDHLVSEAFYLHDPDGLGIEVYADRPRDSWRRVGRELMMATDPVDVAGLVRAAGETPWSGMPAGTVMGHVHLHVGDLDAASAFYGDSLGFDTMAWSYPGARFFGAGGYHHHLGTNTWAERGAMPAAEDESRLLEWTFVLPDATAREEVAASLSAGGHAIERSADVALITSDPWGTRLRITND